MDARALISLLSDGEFHSGSELGTKLGVSRAAVWKALGRLEEFDLEVESSKGRGYRLKGGIHLLDQSRLTNLLSSQVQNEVSLEVLLSVDSTNQYLIDSELNYEANYRVVLAEQQTSGRGRRGRTWISPFGKNVYMSVGFDLQGGVEALGGLSLVVGLAVVRAIKECSTADAQLKWPNDVWIEGKKAAGILVELQGEATTGWSIVVGLGVNVEMSDKQAAEIDQPWVALGQYLSCEREVFVARLIDQLVEVLDEFRVKGLNAFIQEWREVDLLHDREVAIVGSDISGKAEGIDESGALLIRTDDGVRAVNAGEVSVRPHEA